MSVKEPTQEEIKHLVKTQMNAQMLKKYTEEMVVKLGDSITNTLRNFSPNVQLGLQALTNCLVGTSESNGVSLENLLEQVTAAYGLAKKAREDNSGEAPGANKPEPLVKPSKGLISLV